MFLNLKKKNQNKISINFVLVEIVKKRNISKLKIIRATQIKLANSEQFVKFIKSLFCYLHQRKFRQPLTYHKMPFYSNFNYKFTKWISKYHRPLLAVPPIISALKLGFNYQNNFKWYLSVGITGIFLIVNTVNLIRDFIYKERVEAHIKSIKDSGSIFIRYGVPGAGKTSSLFSDFKVLADIMWEKICLEYKLLKPYLKEIKYWKDEIREDAEEIIEAYNFYKKSKTYPCLWSTVPAFCNGQPLNRLTADHLLQRKKLPYGSICLCDEMSLIMPQELRYNRPTEVKEFCKFPRHIGDLHLGTTEQAKDNMLNDFRNSASEFKCMVKQQWVLSPRFFIWLRKTLLKSKIVTANKITSNIFKIWGKINSSIGYRKYFYYDAGTADNVQKTKIKTFILPSKLDVQYDDRAFRNIYRAKNLPLEVSKWTHLRLSEWEIDEIFTKEIENLTKTKEQKKAEAKEKRLKKKGQKTNEV